MLKEVLELPDATTGSYAQAVDPELQWSISGVRSTHHRVKNNLPGTPDFCPMVFRTPMLNAMVERDLAGRARELVADVPADILARTAAFLRLKVSRSSFEIEGERPPQDRALRCGQVIAEVGQRTIDVPEFLRLQRIAIGDARFVSLGLRREGGFVGEHDRQHGKPMPEHISARHQDLDELMKGLVAYDALVCAGMSL